MYVVWVCSRECSCANALVYNKYCYILFCEFRETLDSVGVLDIVMPRYPVAKNTNMRSCYSIMFMITVLVFTVMHNCYV